MHMYSSATFISKHFMINSMDVYETIKNRRSVRKYLDSPIPFDKIARIIDAGHNAPCAGNLQAWRFIVVKTKEKIAEIAKNAYEQLWMGTAPVIIVICADNTKIKRAYGVRGERLYSIQDCALAAMNMLLAAEEEDLASCFVGAFDERMLKRTLDIPDTARPQAIITLGYPDEKPATPLKTELKDILFFDKWGNREDIKEFFPLEQYVKSGKSVAKKLGEKKNILKDLKKILKKK